MTHRSSSWERYLLEQADAARPPLPTWILDDPACRLILEALVTLHDLGFDPRHPEVLVRAVAWGRRQHSERSRPDMPPPVARNLSGVVYYMRTGGIVKIGTSTDITTRVQNLHPDELMTVEPGGWVLEHARHRQFAELLLRNELFLLRPPLTEHIEQVRARFSADFGEEFPAWLKQHRLRPEIYVAH